MLTAQEALQRLRDGNQRFMTATQRHEIDVSPAQRQALVDGQEPFAAILGCADSRVPAEIVFDQGLGDLFVTRVAGNIVASSQLGSLEYAVHVLGTRLIVVVGHSGCGAVQATIDWFAKGEGELTPSLMKIVERIRPAVEACNADGTPPADMLGDAVRANVYNAVDALRTTSSLLSGYLEREELLIVGAEYVLDSGEVRFLDDTE